MKFKDFLLESSDKIDLAEVVKLIKKNCTGFDPNKLIYRGTNSVYDFRKVNSNEGEGRSSRNTKNYYTVIMDKLLKEKDLPLRSKSYITTNSINYTEDYGDELYVVIPYDTAKIGMTPRNDIWFTPINKTNKTFIDMNRFYTNNRFSDSSYESFIKSYTDFLKTTDPEDDEPEFSKYIKNDDVDQMIRARYDLDKNGFKFATGKNYTEIYPKARRDVEFWIQGEMIMIHHKHLNKLLKLLK